MTMKNFANIGSKGMDSMEEENAAISQSEESNIKKLQETATNIARERPENTARLIRTWLLETDIESIDSEAKKGFTSCRKAAVLLVTVGSDISKEICNYLLATEIEAIAFEIAKLKTIEHDQKGAVLQEFHNRIVSDQLDPVDGVGFAIEVVAQSLGSQKAVEFSDRFLSTRPFGFIRRVDPAHLLNFIQTEHPQTIALVLAHLRPNKASVILEGLSSDMQSEVARRIATMERNSPEILREVERTLERKISTLSSSEDFPDVGGVESLMEILNMVGAASRKQIIETLEDKNPELAEEIKKMMIVTRAGEEE